MRHSATNRRKFLDISLENELDQPFVFGATHHSLGVLLIITEKQGPAGERIGEAHNKKLEIMTSSNIFWICVVLTA